jgi:hypothetical protein
MISVLEEVSSLRDGWRTGEEASERKREELSELKGKSEAIELGVPGIEFTSRSRCGGEDGGDGREAMDRGELGGE